jgi:hypothetical protein
MLGTAPFWGRSFTLTLAVYETRRVQKFYSFWMAEYIMLVMKGPDHNVG